MVIKHKNYSVVDLYKMFGPNWAYKLNLSNIPKFFNKPVIQTFDDFDTDTKQKYILIAKTIKDANPNKNINVWATGSRVDGSWKTKEEAENQAKEYNRKTPKYSDYDFITDAENIPNLQFLGFPCHGFFNKDVYISKVLIPI